MTIATAISKRIKASGMSRYGVAKALSDDGTCSMSTAYRMLNMETGMTLEMAEAVAKAVGCKLVLVPAS